MNNSVCVSMCLLAFVFLTGMLATMMTSTSSPMFDKFYNTLDEKQKKIYKKVKVERLRIFLEGMILGLLLATVLVVSLNGVANENSRVCLFVFVTLIVNAFYYHLAPKSTYMVKHLDKEEQRVAWLEIYKTMKYKKIAGMLMGILGYFLLAMVSIKRGNK